MSNENSTHIDDLVNNIDSLTNKESTTVSDNEDTYIPGTFEGPEKTLEVIFHPKFGPENGLRALTRDQLDNLCTKARCTIMHVTSNDHFDAYVLSESSLFVYNHRYIMKTCGTTTLLHCLDLLLEYTDQLDMELLWVGYSRKNLNFPEAQSWPHSSFQDEINFFNTHEMLMNRLRGDGHILGPITKDHWFVYIADHPKSLKIDGPLPSTQGCFTPYRTINLMMFDIDLEVGKIFYLENSKTADEMTKKSGIDLLCPGAIIDPLAFTPCGYSMNSVKDKHYSTIHITPEPECSYSSFETNELFDDYSPLVNNVLSTFLPKRFVLTMFGDNESMLKNYNSLPFFNNEIIVQGKKYTRVSYAKSIFDIEQTCMMACYQQL